MANIAEIGEYIASIVLDQPDPLWDNPLLEAITYREIRYLSNREQNHLVEWARTNHVMIWIRSPILYFIREEDQLLYRLTFG